VLRETSVLGTLEGIYCNSEDNSWELASIIFEDAPSVVSKFHDNYLSAIQNISTSQITLQVQKLSDNTHLPTSGLEFAAGKDLYSAVFVKIPPRSQSLVPTDISIAVPEEHHARITLRSRLALKHSINVAAGVIDVVMCMVQVWHRNDTFSVSLYFHIFWLE